MGATYGVSRTLTMLRVPPWKGGQLAAGASAPWTPAKLTNTIYWDGIVGNGGVFSNNPPVTPSTNGGPCATLKGLYSSSINAVQTTPLNRPTATNVGLTLDTDGLDSMTPGTTLVLDPTIGYTCILVLNNPVGQLMPFLGNNLGNTPSFFGLMSGYATFIDDGNNVLQPTNFTGGSISAMWVDCDTSGNITIRATGDIGAATITSSNTATFNQLGLAGQGFPLQNDDLGNLYIAAWLISSDISYSSPTAASMRAWLLSKYGATLPYP